MTITKEPSESAMRRRALCRGYRVLKSRQQEHCNNLGKYQLVDRWQNIVVLGDSFEADLDDVAEFLADKPTTNGYPN